MTTSGTWLDITSLSQEHLGITPVMISHIAKSLLVILLFLVIRILIHSIAVRRMAGVSRKYLLVKTTS